MILHESYHKLYKHLTTWRWMYDESPQLANIACDYVINCKLIDDNDDGFAKMPDCGLFDADFRGMDSAQVYKLLKDSDTEPNGGGFDSHDWEGAEELTDDEQRDLEREIDEAIRQGALIAGKLGTGGDRDLDELLQPQVDWREVLREFVQSTCTGHDYSTWARPNRRFIAANVYLPSTISERVDELVIAIDTSASISQSDITTFLSEVKSICDVVQPETVRLLYWDTSVCGDEKYNGAEVANMVASTKPKGGGGTYVECVTKHMQAESITPQAVIVFTDGYLGGDWGTWSCPVLWCLLNNKRAVPDNGKLLRINNL
ncbi:MAG: VWA-like domain-containing protein [Opitutae bacterium]